jgi:hypothetical protein
MIGLAFRDSQRLKLELNSLLLGHSSAMPVPTATSSGFKERMMTY